ncbi:MAG: hypothetical protein JNM61_03560 [Zoogloeaceae bacterium]|nr:hypothetical protein [Zoogloeaceae bacterium]
MLEYNDNDQEHRLIAGSLGALMALVQKNGLKTKDVSHAYYAGHELCQIDPSAVAWKDVKKGFFVKKDVPGKGKTTYGRTQNRVVVPVDATGVQLAGIAWLWRHDERIIRLGKGFFTKATVEMQMYL